MKKILFLLLFVIVEISAQSFQIKYQSTFEGKVQENQDPIVVFTNPDETYLITEKILNGSKPIPFEIQKINHSNNEISQFAFLKNNKIANYNNLEILSKQKFELKDDTKKILGYTCKKAVTTINSNSIEIWYTQDLKVKGGPSLLGQDLGLVLEIIRNGSSSTKAIEIKKSKNFSPDFLFKNKKITSTEELSYKDLVWKSKFTTLPIFENELIRFSDQSKSDENIKRFANGTIILKKIQFPEIGKTHNIFLELTEQSNGDAYDRTGTVFLIPEGKETTFYKALSEGIDKIPTYENGNGKKYQGVVSTPSYESTIELMRFFTPFGIQKFNHLKLKDKTWEEKVHYRQDITEFQNLLSGKSFWIGVFIGNYDQGGHKVSAEITIHDEGLNVFKNNFSKPLFNTTNIMEMAGQDYATMFNSPKGLLVNFMLEKDLKNAQLRYITTGHGGWENGDEFLPKENRIFLDEKLVNSFIPWRTDCGSYRLYNPASGNFGNGLSSSDYSRSNWCPGTTTNPEYISLGDLKAGNHTMQIQIPQGENEGSSFSSWNVSGVLLGAE